MSDENADAEDAAEYVVVENKIKQLRDVVFAKPSKEDVVSKKAQNCLDCWNYVCKWIETKPSFKLFQEALVELYDVTATLLLSGDWYNALIKGNGKLMGVMDTELRLCFNAVMSEALEKELVEERKRFHQLLPMIDKNPWSIFYINDLIQSGGDIDKALGAVKELLQNENELMIRIRLGLMFQGRMFKEAAQIADYLYGISENLEAIGDMARYYDEIFFSDVVLIYYTAISVVEKRKYDRDVKNEAKSGTVDTAGPSLVKPPRTKKKISLPLVCETLDRLSNKNFCKTRIVSCWTGWSEAFTTVTTVLVNTVLVERKFLTGISHLKTLFQYWINCYDTTSKDQFAPWNIFNRTEKIPSGYIYTLADVVISNIQTDKSFVVRATEMYIHALNCDINDMDQLYVDANHCKQDEEWKSRRRKLADRYCEFASILRENKRLMKDAIITAFSLCPTEELLERIFSDELKLSAEEEQVPVESIKLVYEGEVYELQKELKYDLNSVLENPREKHFSWIKTENEFKQACEDYLKKGGKKILKKEDLKHLVVDFNEYKPVNSNPLTEESWIEKGYELKGKARYRNKPKIHKPVLTKKGDASGNRIGARKPRKLTISKPKFAKPKMSALSRKPQLIATLSAATKSRKNNHAKTKKIPQRVTVKFHPRRSIPKLSGVISDNNDSGEEIPSLELNCFGMEKFIPRPCMANPTEETDETKRLNKPPVSALQDLFFRITAKEACPNLERNHINVIGGADFNAKYLKQASSFSMSTISNNIREDLTTPADASTSLFSKTRNELREKIKSGIEDGTISIPTIHAVTSKPIVELERNIPDTLVDEIVESLALDVVIKVMRDAMKVCHDACANPSSSPTLVSALGLASNQIPRKIDPRAVVNLFSKIIEEQVPKDKAFSSLENTPSISRPENYLRHSNRTMLKRQPGPKSITERRYANAIVEKTAATVRQNLLLKQKSLALGFAGGNLISAAVLPHITVPENYDNSMIATLPDSVNCNVISPSITSSAEDRSGSENSFAKCDAVTHGPSSGIRLVHFTQDLSELEGILAQHCLDHITKSNNCNTIRKTSADTKEADVNLEGLEPIDGNSKCVSEPAGTKDSASPTFNIVLRAIREVYGISIPNSDGVVDDKPEGIIKLHEAMEFQVNTLVSRKQPVVMLNKLKVKKLKPEPAMPKLPNIDPETGKPKRGRPRKQAAKPSKSSINHRIKTASVIVAPRNINDHKIPGFHVDLQQAAPVQHNQTTSVGAPRIPYDSNRVSSIVAQVQSPPYVRSASILKKRNESENTGQYQPLPKPMINVPPPVKLPSYSYRRLSKSHSNNEQNVVAENLPHAFNAASAPCQSAPNFSVKNYVSEELQKKIREMASAHDCQVWEARPQQVEDQINCSLITPSMLESCSASSKSSSFSAYGSIEVGRSAQEHPGSENPDYCSRPVGPASSEFSIGIDKSSEREHHEYVSCQDLSITAAEPSGEETLSLPSPQEELPSSQLLSQLDTKSNEPFTCNSQSVGSNVTPVDETVTTATMEAPSQNHLPQGATSEEAPQKIHESHSSSMEVIPSTSSNNNSDSVYHVYLNDSTGQFDSSAAGADLKFEDAMNIVENPIVFEEPHVSEVEDERSVGNDTFFGPMSLTDDEDEDQKRTRKISASSGSSYVPGDDEVELTETSPENSSNGDLFNPLKRRKTVPKASKKRTRRKSVATEAPFNEFLQEFLTPRERERMTTCRVMLKRSSLHLGNAICKQVEEIIVSSSSGSQNEDSGMDNSSTNVRKHKRRSKSRIDDHQNSENNCSVKAEIDPNETPGPSKSPRSLRSRRGPAVKRGKPYGPKSKRRLVVSSEENSPAPVVVCISDSEPETIESSKISSPAAPMMDTSEVQHNLESVKYSQLEIMDLNLPEEDAEEEPKIDPLLDDETHGTSVDLGQTASPPAVCNQIVQLCTAEDCAVPSTDEIQIEDVLVSSSVEEQLHGNKEDIIIDDSQGPHSLADTVASNIDINDTIEGIAQSEIPITSADMSPIAKSKVDSPLQEDMTVEEPHSQEPSIDGSSVDDDESYVPTTDEDDDDIEYGIENSCQTIEMRNGQIEMEGDDVEEVCLDEEVHQRSGPLVLAETIEEAPISDGPEVQNGIQTDLVFSIDDTISDDIDNDDQKLEDYLDNNIGDLEKISTGEVTECQEEETSVKLIERTDNSMGELSVDVGDELEDVTEAENDLSPNVAYNYNQPESSHIIASLAAPSPLCVDVEDGDPLDISDMRREETGDVNESVPDTAVENTREALDENSMVTLKQNPSSDLLDIPNPVSTATTHVELIETTCAELLENDSKDVDPLSTGDHTKEVRKNPVRLLFLPIPPHLPARKMSQSSEGSDEVTVLEVRASSKKSGIAAAKAGSSRRKVSQPIKSLARILPHLAPVKPIDAHAPKSNDAKLIPRSYRLRERKSISTPAKFKGYEVGNSKRRRGKQTQDGETVESEGDCDSRHSGRDSVSSVETQPSVPPKMASGKAVQESAPKTYFVLQNPTGSKVKTQHYDIDVEELEMDALEDASAEMPNSWNASAGYDIEDNPMPSLLPQVDRPVSTLPIPQNLEMPVQKQGRATTHLPTSRPSRIRVVPVEGEKVEDEIELGMVKLVSSECPISRMAALPESDTEIQELESVVVEVESEETELDLPEQDVVPESDIIEIVDSENDHHGCLGFVPDHDYLTSRQEETTESSAHCEDHVVEIFGRADTEQDEDIECEDPVESLVVAGLVNLEDMPLHYDAISDLTVIQPLPETKEPVPRKSPDITVGYRRSSASSQSSNVTKRTRQHSSKEPMPTTRISTRSKGENAPPVLQEADEVVIEDCDEMDCSPPVLERFDRDANGQ